MSIPEIEIRNVYFSYNGNSVLENISFAINERDFIGIIGPNGGGKTTLLKLIVGMFEPDKGEIRVFGSEPSKMSRQIGYVPQNTDINEKFPISVKEVTFTGRLGKRRRILRYSGADHESVREALEMVEMWEYRDARIGDLSTGQRKRVFIARAMATDPKIMVLDEPTANIDPAGQAKLFEILKNLNERLTILFVSHDLNMLLEYVNKVACVNRELVFHDAPHVTTEMLSKTFGFSIEQICPLEELPPAQRDGSRHEAKGKNSD